MIETLVPLYILGSEIVCSNTALKNVHILIPPPKKKIMATTQSLYLAFGLMTVTAELRVVCLETDHKQT
jgi:hypothetical protein